LQISIIPHSPSLCSEILLYLHASEEYVLQKTVHFFSYIQIGYSVSLWQGRKRIKVALSGAICDRIQMCATQLANSNFPVSPFFLKGNRSFCVRSSFIQSGTIQFKKTTLPAVDGFVCTPHPIRISSFWIAGGALLVLAGESVGRLSDSSKWWPSFTLVQMPPKHLTVNNWRWQNPSKTIL